MNNMEKYRNAFKEAFGVDDEKLGGKFTSDLIEQWDSVTHMALVAALEDAFDILIGTDDVFELTSYEKGMEILKKYDVEL